jgi:cell filamentation protein
VEFLAEQANATFAALARDLADQALVAGLSVRETWVPWFAGHFADLNALHPFREGNGRAQKTFFRQLAMSLDWVVDWASVEPEEHREAVARSLDTDNELLEQLVDRISRPVEPE